MVFDFSKLDLHNRPVLILETLSGRKLQSLGYAMNIDASLKYNEVSELSFSVPKMANGIAVPNYGNLVGWNVIHWKDIGKFILVDPSISNEGIKEIKECKAYSLEFEWITKQMYLPEDVYNFWNPVAPDDSLLGQIMLRVPHWKIGHVDATLIGKYRSLDEMSENLYDFVKSTVQKSYECVFEFDTLEMIVNVKDVSSAVPFSPIHLSTHNLLKSIEIKEDSQNIVTCAEVLGAEGVDISGVNPTGLRSIYNLDYFMNETHFSKDVINKWENWKTSCENMRRTYFDLMIERDLQSGKWLAENAFLIQLQAELEGLENQQTGVIQADEDNEYAHLVAHLVLW